MDEHHTFVKTMTALMFEFGNLWGGLSLNSKWHFFDKESSHKLVNLGTPFFGQTLIKKILIYIFVFLRVFA